MIVNLERSTFVVQQPAHIAQPSFSNSRDCQEATISDAMFDLVAETSSSEDESNARVPKRLKAWQEDDSKHPRVWFDRELANELWMPAAADLHAHPRPANRAPRDSQSVMATMLTSWFEVSNFVDAPCTPWRGLAPREPRQLSDRCSDGALTSERTEPPDKTVNSVVKLRLYPDRQQRAKLDQMFASNRAIYNKLVASSKDDCRSRLVLRGRGNETKKMTERAECAIHTHRSSQDHVRLLSEQQEDTR